MSVLVRLSTAPDARVLQALLPVLQYCPRVLFRDGSKTIVCEADEEAGVSRERLRAALADVQPDCSLAEDPSVAIRAEEAAPFTVATLALTVIVPAGGSLPDKLAAVLLHSAAPMLSMRCLAAGDGLRSAFELYLGPCEQPEDLRAALRELAQRSGVDLLLAAADSKRPRRRLVAFDMDSTLIDCEVIDELAERAGVGEAVAEVTARAMRGELDFCSSFRERMARLRGLEAAEIQQVARNLPLMPGAQRLLRGLAGEGYYTVILSGGFDYFARQLQELLGIDEVHANHLQIADGRLTGEVDGPIVDGERKLQLLEEVAAARGFALHDTVAVGDGANDLPMLGRAGLGVAFHAKPLVREKAAAAVSFNDLDALLLVLGIADLSSALAAAQSQGTAE